MSRSSPGLGRGGRAPRQNQRVLDYPPGTNFKRKSKAPSVLLSLSRRKRANEREKTEQQKCRARRNSRVCDQGGHGCRGLGGFRASLRRLSGVGLFVCFISLSLSHGLGRWRRELDGVDCDEWDQLEKCLMWASFFFFFSKENIILEFFVRFGHAHQTTLFAGRVFLNMTAQVWWSVRKRACFGTFVTAVWDACPPPPHHLLRRQATHDNGTRGHMMK